MHFHRNLRFRDRFHGSVSLLKQIARSKEHLPRKFQRIGRNPNRVLRSMFFKRRADLTLGGGRIGPEPGFLFQFPWPLNLRQQKQLPLVGAVNVAHRILRALQMQHQDLPKRDS